MSIIIGGFPLHGNINPLTYQRYFYGRSVRAQAPIILVGYFNGKPAILILKRMVGAGSVGKPTWVQQIALFPTDLARF
ncbi:MAG: hypothetical protein GY943_02390 [Chloroflexi bacterium]|nr:hypothetical protein [Chloroflexota bacterium]